MSELEKMQKELNHYREMFGMDDIATKGYRAVVNMLRQQVEVLDNYSIKDNIEKGDKSYDRATKMYNEMPKMIMELKELKDKLGIEFVEKVERGTATTPQSIGFVKS